MIPTMSFKTRRVTYDPRVSQFPVQDAFKPLEPLAAKLYSFVHGRFVHALSHELFPSSAEDDFTQFLNYFEETIEDMEKQQKRDWVLEEILHTHVLLFALQ
jgi:hypothetical protein